MIEIKHVNKSFGGKRALHDVSLTLPRGQIVGLFGENGAGKTTLMKCMLGFLRFQGEITLDGAPISRQNIARLAFATSEHSFFPNLTPASHQEFYQLHFPQFRAKRFAGLMEFFQLPEHRALRHFSTGQKNQFEVILALCQGADYILMDEPFAGNDVFNREDFYKVLLGILQPTETVLLSTHLLEEVENFIGRAVLIRQGRIVGDVSMLDLQESGKGLLAYVKETYHYRADRVSKTLSELTDDQ
ncbi:MAG: ABC transporter ATP-binding protein [Bacillota bacterium]|jgi:ABC-2 type transport system ATP-binding protein